MKKFFIFIVVAFFLFLSCAKRVPIEEMGEPKEKSREIEQFKARMAEKSAPDTILFTDIEALEYTAVSEEPAITEEETFPVETLYVAEVETVEEEKEVEKKETTRAIEEVREEEPVEEEEFIETEEVIKAPPSVRFRVQIGAFKVQKNAIRLHDKMLKKYNYDVYIEEVPPYWKVRVGNCATIEEVISLKREMKDMGFTDAWIIQYK